MNYNLKNSLFENNNFEIVNNSKSFLISKNVENYFNDLLKTPENLQIGNGKENFTFSKFYNEYIEHNILLIFIIICLVIFLIVKYLNKNYYNISENYNNPNEKYFDDDDDDDNNYTKLRKKKEKKEKYIKLKKEIIKQKRLIELEKQSVLDIIDQLSKINNEELINNSVNLNNLPQIQNPNDDYLENHYYNDEPQISLMSANELDDGNYYNIQNANYKDKKSPNYINGIYIESPYQE